MSHVRNIRLIYGRTSGGDDKPVRIDTDGIVQVSSSGGGGGAVTLRQGLDYDTGAGTATTDVVGIGIPAIGGPVGVSASNPFPVITNGLPLHDYVSLAVASTTDTYTFKTGGSGGTTVATVVVTYTDSTKAVLSNVTRT